MNPDRPIGRRHHVIIDCADPMTEARCWSAVLGDPITYADEDFVVVSADTTTSGMAFQLSPDTVPPTWPVFSKRRTRLSRLSRKPASSRSRRACSAWPA